MQYALLIHEDETIYRQDGRAWTAIIAAHQAFAGELVAAGAMRGGAGLKTADTATTLRRSADGATHLHDGPFAESKEQLGGFYLIEAPDLDAALAWARKLPMAGAGSIEVRPVIDED
ncbi:YciI family protein [Caulobacter sp.]|uniref:YciI family protein n=1 Tax=Caulobacter sp. TaxID=78 RepID=UPI003BADBE4B